MHLQQKIKKNKNMKPYFSFPLPQKSRFKTLGKSVVQGYLTQTARFDFKWVGPFQDHI